MDDDDDIDERLWKAGEEEDAILKMDEDAILKVGDSGSPTPSTSRSGMNNGNGNSVNSGMSVQGAATMHSFDDVIVVITNVLLGLNKKTLVR